MNILVINGSPKGKLSVTIHSVEYLQKHFPDDNFEVLPVGQQIKKYQAPELVLATIKKMRACDLVLFAYPVYTFLAPYQLHRFIEELKENMEPGALKGIKSTQLSTSKHFFDVTAHRYMEENCHDLGLGVIKGLSADMDDLLTPKGRKELIGFWNYVRFSVANGFSEPPKITENRQPGIYRPRLDRVEKSETYKTVIVTNCGSDDSNLQNMIEDFMKAYPYRMRVINILDLKFDGGCLGCFNCAIHGKCVYKDGFDSFLREEIQSSDSIVYAAAIKDHSMGASFKRYDDRQFCNGHRSVTMGMPIGYLLSGNYSKEGNVRDLIEGRNEVGHTFLSGVATDESADDSLTAEGIEALAKTMAYALEQKLVMPQNFFGIGGMKIFRDLIYIMGGLMKADHKFYKKNRFYNFPQKQFGMRIMSKSLGLLMSMASAKKTSSGKMNHYILSRYRHAIAKK